MMFTHSLFLSTRCILHLKPIGELNIYFTFEKIISFLVIFLFALDSIEMIKRAVLPIRASDIANAKDKIEKSTLECGVGKKNIVRKKNLK